MFGFCGAAAPQKPNILDSAAAGRRAARRGRLARLKPHLHQAPLVLALHMSRGFFGPNRGFQPSFHMGSKILRLV